ARGLQASGDARGQERAADADLQAAVDGLGKSAAGVVARGVEHHAVAARLELHRRVDDEPLGAAEAELGVEEGGLHVARNTARASSRQPSCQLRVAVRRTPPLSAASASGSARSAASSAARLAPSAKRRPFTPGATSSRTTGP